MKKKNLLLHTCCAPCAVYVFLKLKEKYTVTGFFYNPNIQPKKEYEFRKNEFIKISEKENWPIVIAEYDMNEWFQTVKGFEKEPEKGKRCSLCFNMRLKKTFDYAKKNGFDIVASTLSISPYKVTDQINAEGERVSKIFNIEFLPENFKKKHGYSIGKRLAIDKGIKHQNYCGCVFSKVEKKLKESKK